MGSSQSSQESELSEEFNWNESIETSDLNILFDLNEPSNESSQQRDRFSDKLTSCVENCLKGKLKKLKTLNIMVVGITGCGKSTLINNLFREQLADEGIGNAVTQHITKYCKPDLNLNIYDTPGFELGESRQKELLKGISKIHNPKDISQCIHCLLYCVKSEVQRFQNFEKDFIEKFSNHSDLKNIPIIIVITQSFDTHVSNEMKRYIESINLNVVGVIPVLAKERIINQNAYEAFGLEELVGLIKDNLPCILHETLNNAQTASIKHKRDCSIGVISGAVVAAAAAGGSPIPFTDAALLIPVEIAMLAGITAIYGINVSPEKILLILSCTLYNGAASFLVRTAVVNAIKCIPGIGTVIGGVISGTSAAFITGAIGATYTTFIDYVIKENIDINSLEPDTLKGIVQPMFQNEMAKKRKR